MISDQITEEICADESEKTRAKKRPIAVHLDIDGKLEATQSPLNSQQNFAKARSQKTNAALSSREANLRRIVYLQRQLLAQQSDRVQRQQALIISLNKDLTRIQSRLALESNPDKKRFYNWLGSLIPFKNPSK